MEGFEGGMIKALIFDYGGVFSKEGSFRKFCKRHAEQCNYDAEGFLKILYKNWGDARVGKIDSMRFWEELAGFVGKDTKTFRKEIITMLGFRPEVLEFVMSLKGKYKLGMVTNTIEDWFEETRKKYDLDSVFDAIVTSYEMKIAKPDLEIFKECAKKLDVEAKECVYIDDLDKNIPPALELGMKVVKFESLGQMKEELEKIGVILK